VRFVLATLSAMLTAAAWGQPAMPLTVEAAVSAAVENFQPLEPPPRGQLRGWVIGIDPAGADVSLRHGPLYDDLSLITAAHLYHFVRHAGGKPVLTRTDHTRAVDASRLNILAETGCELCVSIHYSEVGGKVFIRSDSPENHPRDAALAAELSSALQFKLAEPNKHEHAVSDSIKALSQVDAMADIPFCQVHFESSPEAATMDPALRKICFDNARRLYEGIRRFCVQPHRPEPSAKPVPDTLASDSGNRLERLVSSIWPEGRMPDDRVEWFCRQFADEAITNPSLVYFEVQTHPEQDGVILRGQTNAPLLAIGLEKALRAVGIEQVSNQTRTLPDRDHLGEHLFGACRVPMALTYDQPESSGRPQTQLLFGEPLFLLDLEGESYLLHSGDGYWGWVHRDAVQPMTFEQFDAYVRHPPGAVVRDIDNGRVRIPRGSNVRLLRATESERVILLPDGATLSVPAAAVMLRDSEGPQANARVRAALDLLYVPYVFGGRSPLGLDCSGLASNVWSRLGITLARDAWQQALAGQLVATRWHRANIRPGDQLFLIDESGKIYHTGLALDAVHVIHCTAPCVQIGSFDPQDPLYDVELDRNFFMVKRP
jgi:hypothetical protein